MGRKLKILHISTEKSWRGGEQQIAYLIENLPKQEVESIVFVFEHSAFHQYLKDKKYTYIAYSNKSALHFKNIRLLNQVVKDEDIDILHAHSSNAHSLAFLKNLVFKQTKLVVSRRVDFIPKMTFFSKCKYNHSSINKYICVSHAIENIMKNSVSDSSKVTTVHSGIDMQKWKSRVSRNRLRESYGFKESTKIIGTIAAIEEHKDLKTFVNVAYELKNEDYVFFIVGSGSLKGQIQSQISALKLENIFLTGFQPNIQNYLYCYDLFLFTSKTEGLGTALLDAMAAKIPIVSTNAGGISEIVTHNVTGLTSEAGNERKLAHNIKILMQNNTLKSKLIENAYQKVLSFSAKNMAQKTFEIYKTII